MIPDGVYRSMVEMSQDGGMGSYIVSHCLEHGTVIPSLAPPKE